MDGHTAEQVLLRLQDELKSLQLQPGLGGDAYDFRGPPPSKGSGPRLFCGHVPKEATEDLVKAHFSRWGVVTDVYFPRHKKTLKRRPFCFVTFAMRDSAERALAESPLSICGIPIKNLTMVEDRDKYYKEKHAAAHQALLTALNSMGAAGALAPEQVNNIAALLAMEGVSSEVVLSMLLNPPQQNYVASPPQLPPLVQQQGSNNFSAFLPPLQQQSSGDGRFSAPQLGGHTGPAPSDFFFSSQQGTPQQQQFLNHQQLLQQQQQHVHRSPPSAGGNSANSMRSASGPLPNNIGPFGSMMSREGSFSSLSTLSDWYSTTSSARTSLDLGGLWGPSNGQPPARLSMDAAIQLRQQLMAVAAVTQGGQSNSFTHQNGVGGNASMGAASTQAQWLAAQNLSAVHQRTAAQQQQQQAAPGAAAAVFQSAFYQSDAPVPINNVGNNNINNNIGGGSGGNSNGAGISSPIQTANSLPLPPIREGHPVGPLDPYSAAVWASAQYGGSTLRGSGGGINAANNTSTAASFLGGSAVVGSQRSSSSPFSSGPVSPVRPSLVNAINTDMTIQLQELSLSSNSRKNSPNTGLPLGLPDSSNSDQDSLGVSSSRDTSGGITAGDEAVAATWQAAAVEQGNSA